MDAIYHNKRAGFSLIELSIVLVIIGLLAGSILVGRDMMKAAELRSQIRQLDALKAAFFTFKTKYNEYPGDMASATSYWSDAVAGNGNATIEFPANNYYDLGAVSWAAAVEPKQLFIQLNRAGFLSDTLDGSNILGNGVPQNFHEQ